ncbi:hypothetical protein [Mycoplasma sp. OR1901]|uniref:hypothetical protein n=1 Tax=Mycoplasma sp. OR1901 TaxID=2742195 RepID=UPI001582AC92|nr:hypothetical protein [Mycoplasma sp. OR1901]QKT05560.1 hypothetical protein HTZ87_02490 [Mycoplasma sp. OR1901]
MHENSEIKLVEDSNGLCFITGDNRIYEAKTPKGHQLTPIELWMIKKGLDPSDTNMLRLANLYSLNSKFTNHNISKIQKLLENKTENYEEIKELLQDIFDKLSVLQTESVDSKNIILENKF